MKKLALLLLLAAPAMAQTNPPEQPKLKHRAGWIYDIGRVGIDPPMCKYLEDCQDAPLVSGMIWAPIKVEKQRLWKQQQIGSCRDCLAPMTFKRAFFSKKILTLLALDVAANVADTESTLRKPCIAAHTCREINPIMGNTRAQQYGIKFSITGVTWLCAAYLRKGDAGKHIGGDKRYWWTFVASIALHGTAATLNTALHN
jgi:hypothetical protein